MVIFRCKSTEYRDMNLNFVPPASIEDCFSNSLAYKMIRIFAYLNLFYKYFSFCMHTSLAVQI